MNRLARAARQWIVAGIAVACLRPAIAEAVVVYAMDSSVTSRAPADDPGWNNVAHLAGAGAVYLGNRWVLTANHVSDGSITLSDGRSFAMVPGSSRQLANTGSAAIFGSPDLKMFRLVDDPGLPSLTINDARPGIRSTLMMIGSGRDAAPGFQGWQLTNGTNGFDWKPTALPLANATGFNLLPTSSMRWGTNEAAAGAIFANNNTLAFSTTFDRVAGGYEAQAAPGDSGGGVFQKVDGQWQLAGIMVSQQLLSNQPSDTSVFGDQTYSADLAVYRAQIDDLLTRADSAWQNQANYYDVNRSGMVTGIDVLLIINDLTAHGIHPVSGTPGAGKGLLDVNGDGQITGNDALRIINALLGKTADVASPTAATSLTTTSSLVPEPSSLALAAMAAAALTLWAARRRGRRA